MRQVYGKIEIRTKGRGLLSCEREVASWLEREACATDGLLTLVILHTSASLIVQENADPAVQTDLDRWLSRLVRNGDPLFEHTAEGPDDMPAHVRAALLPMQISVPVSNGEMALGTWQTIYVFEHRMHAHRRTIALHYLGE